MNQKQKLEPLPPPRRVEAAEVSVAVSITGMANANSRSGRPRANTTSRGGRPHLGDRRMLAVRTPVPMADEIIRQADEAKMSINDYLVSKLAEAINYPLPPKIDPTQPQLAMGA